MTLHITNGDHAGDTLRGFVDGPVALMCDVLPGADLRLARVAITGAGRDVLAQRADHVRLDGNDVWRGGVHLRGPDRSPWRWDAHRETLVS